MAIARQGSADLTNNGQGGGTPGTNPWTTPSYTCNEASNFLVLVVDGTIEVNSITGASYNGIPMTQAGNIWSPGYNIRCESIFYLFNPPVGEAYTFEITQNSTGGYDDALWAVCADYSGVYTASLGAQPIPYWAQQSEVTSLDTNTYVNAPGSWVISSLGCGTQTDVTSSNLTQVVVGAANEFPYIWDSNGAIETTGAFYNTFSFSEAYIGGTVLSIAPEGVTPNVTYVGLDGSAYAAPGTAGTTNVALTTATAGDLICVVLNTSVATTNVADTEGLEWTKEIDVNNGSNYSTLWYAWASANAPYNGTITVTCSTKPTVQIAAWKNANTTQPFNATASSTTSGDAVSITTTANNCIIVSSYNQDNNEWPDAQVGCSGIASSDMYYNLLEYYPIAVPIGTYSYSENPNASDIEMGIAFAIQAAPPVVTETTYQYPFVGRNFFLVNL